MEIMDTLGCPPAESLSTFFKKTTCRQKAPAFGQRDEFRNDLSDDVFVPGFFVRRPIGGRGK